MPSGKFEDFKENKEEAKKFGEKETKNWELTDKQKKSVAEYVDSKALQEAAKTQLFLSKKDFEAEDKVSFDRLENIEKGMDKAKLDTGVVSYENMDAKDMGFNGDLASGNALNKEGFKEFKDQFEDELVKLDNFYDAKITSDNINSNNRVLLDVKVPSTKGTTFEPHAGIYMDEQGEPHLLADHSYSYSVEKVSPIKIKGKEIAKVDGILEPNVDFASDESGSNAYGDKISADWRRSLNRNEIEAFNGYMKRGYEDINNHLIDPVKYPATEELDKKIETLTDALKRSELGEGLTAYRWAGAKEFGYEIGKIPPFEKFESAWSGEFKEVPSFMSTSLFDSSVQFQAARTILLRLYLPKGTHAGYLSANTFSPFGNELEMLVDKGYKYHITRVREMTINRKKKYLVDATLLLK